MGLDGYRALAPWGSDRSIRFSGGADHDPSIGSWLIEEARPLDWERLSRRLGDIVARHGQQMLRLKGVVHTTDDPRPLVIHGVQRVFHAPVRLGRWNREPATSIVVIGDREVYPAIEAITDAVREAATEPAKFETA